MRSLQVIDGYISVFELMTEMGYTRPGTYWKELLKKHQDTLPEHKMLQFIKANGRKGRKVPAIRKEDEALLIQHFDVLVVASDEIFDREVVQDVLKTLCLAFQDFEPESHLVVGDHTIDLYLKKVRMAIDFVSAPVALARKETLLQREKEIRERLDCTFLTVDPLTEGFHAGQVVFALRKHLGI
ncbi:hypothetical protein [Deinococcus cellulosilyticus]|uniref:Uncharacterized protein n=1 Tax=Deinococcus cellulosilyticus (strain DSM 18568 / NBRC 106333 / KACC 11606 / 5516J-15) TaxID=1223518 RepID=A0A511NB98_DEIC1|nr:hypothetical protein [Deinococcus cellulosilyticus]GEM50100.1 hypothetical protein DC3_57350 [Deinococcus cellulosilyticus NBRC 106333 = KACC 11606]